MVKTGVYKVPLFGHAVSGRKSKLWEKWKRIKGPKGAFDSLPFLFSLFVSNFYLHIQLPLRPLYFHFKHFNSLFYSLYLFHYSHFALFPHIYISFPYFHCLFPLSTNCFHLPTITFSFYNLLPLWHLYFHFKHFNSLFFPYNYSSIHTLLFFHIYTFCFHTFTVCFHFPQIAFSFQLFLFLSTTCFHFDHYTSTLISFLCSSYVESRSGKVEAKSEKVEIWKRNDMWKKSKVWIME